MEPRTNVSRRQRLASTPISFVDVDVDDVMMRDPSSKCSCGGTRTRASVIVSACCGDMEDRS